MIPAAAAGECNIAGFTAGIRMQAFPRTEAPAAAPRVSQRRGDAAALLREPGTLALIGFGMHSARLDDPRHVALALDPVAPADADVFEHWSVSGPVQHGCDDRVRWSRSDDWLFAAIDLGGADDDLAEVTAQAYARLARFMERHPQHHVLRIWNFIADINRGEDDDERYKHFCVGRGSARQSLFRAGYPAATGVGHHDAARALQVHCIAARQPGVRVENPRQVSAWRYPRRYGPVAPGFARAMRFPAGDVLAISGTAAISGHESRHVDDLDAQLDEIRVNLDALLEAGGMPPGFDDRALLRVYVRHAADAPRVAAFLDRHAPGTPRLLLLADICRRELLVEIDGWRYA